MNPTVKLELSPEEASRLWRFLTGLDDQLPASMQSRMGLRLGNVLHRTPWRHDRPDAEVQP